MNAFEMISDESNACYNKKNESIIWLEYEEDDNYFEEDLIYLPSRFDIYEYNIMENFIDNIKDVQIKNILYNSTKGKKVFRRFKDKCFELGIINAWYEFRENSYYEKAKKWLLENNLDYIDDYKRK